MVLLTLLLQKCAVLFAAVPQLALGCRLLIRHELVDNFLRLLPLSLPAVCRRQHDTCCCFTSISASLQSVACVWSIQLAPDLHCSFIHSLPPCLSSAVEPMSPPLPRLLHLLSLPLPPRTSL